MNKKGFAGILVIIIAVAVIGTLTYYIAAKKPAAPSNDVISMQSSPSAQPPAQIDDTANPAPQQLFPAAIPSNKFNKIDIDINQPFKFTISGVTIVPDVAFKGGYFQGIGNGPIFLGDSIIFRTKGGLVALAETNGEAVYYPGPGLGNLVYWVNDRAQNIYFEGRDSAASIWQFNPQTGFQKLPELNKTLGQLTTNLFFDKEANTIWFGSYGVGVFSYGPDKKLIDHSINLRSKFQIQNFGFSLLAGNKEKIFVGNGGDYFGSNGAIFEYTKKTGEWKLIRNEIQNVIASDFSIHVTNDIFLADDNYLWVQLGIRKSGGVSYPILRMNVKTGEWEEIKSLVENLANLRPILRDKPIFYIGITNRLYEAVGRELKEIFTVPAGMNLVGIKNDKLFLNDASQLLVYNLQNKALIRTIPIPKSFFGKSDIKLVASDGISQILILATEREPNGPISKEKLLLMDLSTLNINYISLPSSFPSETLGPIVGEFFDDNFFIITGAYTDFGPPDISRFGIYRYNSSQKSLSKVQFVPQISNQDLRNLSFRFVSDGGNFYLTNDSDAGIAGAKWYSWNFGAQLFITIPRPARANFILNQNLEAFLNIIKSRNFSQAPTEILSLKDTRDRIISNAALRLIQDGIEISAVSELKKTLREDYELPSMSSVFSLFQPSGEVLYTNEAVVVNYNNSLVIFNDDQF